MLIGGVLGVLAERDCCMYWCARGKSNERRRRRDLMKSICSSCLHVSLSSCLRWLLVWLAILLTGCPRGEQEKPQVAAETPRASVALRVLVVNEPAVAE